MFSNTVLNSAQKRTIYKALKLCNPEVLLATLIAAALNNQPFPIENKNFSDLCKLHENTLIPEVKIHLAQAIRTLVSVQIIGLIQKLFKKFFVPNDWQSSFLLFVARTLNIKIEDQVLVQLVIEKGKIHWRIINGTQVVYDRTARKNPAAAFNFTTAKTILMTWEQFRHFKDSGKRGGSVAITKQRLIDEYPENQSDMASTIWDQLKHNGFLDSNDRLSDKWRFAAGIVPLNVAGIRYRYLSQKLNEICANQEYCEKFVWGPNAQLYRPDRSPKVWFNSSRMQNYDPTAESNQVKPWDVSIYRDMNNHSVSEDQLDHDHIPSTAALKIKNKEYKQQLQNIANAKSPGRSSRSSDKDSASSSHSSVNADKLQQLKAETNESWTCIAIPKALHKQGLSHGESSSAQTKQVDKPFLNEVTDYLDKLELNWQNSSNIDEEYLHALGAFRYMYRCQISGKHAATSYTFFNEGVKAQELDALFFERLQKYMEKKEGNIKGMVI